jgi:SAM-dependent methyltransferase
MGTESLAGTKGYGSSLYQTHKMLAGWIRPNSRVLEIGCSTGAFARFLCQTKGCTVVGVELNPAAAGVARGVCERVVCGDAEVETTWCDVASGYDYVVFADVLEHLRYPELALRRSKTVLAPGGAIAMAVPNVAYYTVRLQLLRGHFDYKSYGILDETHLRFFTRDTFKALIGRCDLFLLDLVPELLPLRGERLCDRLGLSPLKHLVDALFWQWAPCAAALKWLGLCSAARDAGPNCRAACGLGRSVEAR